MNIMDIFDEIINDENIDAKFRAFFTTIEQQRIAQQRYYKRLKDITIEQQCETQQKKYRGG